MCTTLRLCWEAPPSGAASVAGQMGAPHPTREAGGEEPKCWDQMRLLVSLDRLPAVRVAIVASAAVQMAARHLAREARGGRPRCLNRMRKLTPSNRWPGLLAASRGALYRPPTVPGDVPPARKCWVRVGRPTYRAHLGDVRLPPPRRRWRGSQLLHRVHPGLQVLRGQPASAC
eukprot:scaffold218778_cov31-Tisochrysis_lutea.AAC.4